MLKFPSDENVVKSLLENQPNPIEVFKRFTFEEVKAGLQEFLSPDGEEGDISSEPAVPFDGEKKNYSLAFIVVGLISTIVIDRILSS